MRGSGGGHEGVRHDTTALWTYCKVTVLLCRYCLLYIYCNTASLQVSSTGARHTWTVYHRCTLEYTCIATCPIGALVEGGNPPWVNPAKSQPYYVLHITQR